MVTKIINAVRSVQGDWQVQQGDEYVGCSVGIMAHNEEANIGRSIHAALKQAISPVVVLIGADVLPESPALEYLCAPFKDPKVGMVGGRPVPVNDPATFMGHAAHLLWHGCASGAAGAGSPVSRRSATIPGCAVSCPSRERARWGICSGMAIGLPPSSTGPIRW